MRGSARRKRANAGSYRSRSELPRRRPAVVRPHRNGVAHQARALPSEARSPAQASSGAAPSKWRSGEILVFPNRQNQQHKHRERRLAAGSSSASDADSGPSTTTGYACPSYAITGRRPHTLDVRTNRNYNMVAQFLEPIRQGLLATAEGSGTIATL